MTDTDRLNALFTLFGGYYAYEPHFRIQEYFRDGRKGLDKFIMDNSSLLGMNWPPVHDADHDSKDATLAEKKSGSLEAWIDQNNREIVGRPED